MQERKKKILEMLTEAEGQFNSSYTKQTHKTNQPTTSKNSQNLHKKVKYLSGCVKLLVLSHYEKSLFASAMRVCVSCDS